MLFTSTAFAIFLPFVFILYWFVLRNNLVFQNVFLLGASYFFYGWWDWRFLSLLVLLSVVNYITAIETERNEANRKGKIWSIAAVIINLGVLGVFKYFNFFIDSFIDLITVFGYNLPRFTTKIILPLGISFYVFISISYLVDVYKHKLNASRNFVEVLLALNFFPIILAGPIQRPISLLPQIAKKREFDYAQVVDGLKQILWGLFAKIVIADKMAPYVNEFFGRYSDFSGSTLVLGAIFFTIQIYADFSGYSNMAIGVAKVLGFNLMQNFAYPYFSRDLTEFWKKWHISLTTWFRDYLFLPISFTISWKIRNEKVFFIRTDYFIYIVASLITWLLTGLWHGANYTYVIWGMINGLILIMYHFQKNPRKKLLKKYGINNKKPVFVVVETLFTLFIIVISWVVFRANSLADAILYLERMFSKSLLSIPAFQGKKVAMVSIFFAILFFLVEWRGRSQQYGIADIAILRNRLSRWAFYYFILAAIIYAGGQGQEFIYLQF